MAISGKVFTIADSNTETLGKLLKDLGGLLGVGTRSDGRYYLSDMCQARGINKWAMYKPVRHSTKSNITNAERRAVGYGLSMDAQYDDEAMQNDTLTEFTYEKPRGKDYNEYNRLRDFDGYNHAAVPPAYVYIYVPGLDSTKTTLDVPIDATAVYARIIYKYRDANDNIVQSQYYANQEIPLTDIKFEGLGTGQSPLTHMKFALTKMNGAMQNSLSAEGALGNVATGMQIDLTDILKGNTFWPKDDDGYYVFYPRLTDYSDSHYWPTGTDVPLKIKTGGAPMNPIVSLSATYNGTGISFQPIFASGAGSNYSFTLNKNGSSATMIVGSTSGTVNWGTSASPITLRITLGVLNITNPTDTPLTYTINGLSFLFQGRSYNAYVINVNTGAIVNITGTVSANKTAQIILGQYNRIVIDNFYGSFSGAAGGSSTQGRANFKPPTMRIQLGYKYQNSSSQDGLINTEIDLSEIGYCYYY